MKMTLFSVYLTLMLGLCQGKISEIPVPKPIQDCYDTLENADIQEFVASKLMWLCDSKISDSQANTSVLQDTKRVSYYTHLLKNAIAYRSDNTDQTTGPRGKRQAGRCVRKEYRVLSDADRGRFHNAINVLKRNTTIPPNNFDAMTLLHVAAVRRAHGGAGFLGWHRLYLNMFEGALREVDSSVCLPYWDTTLDNELPDPTQSVIWTPAFLGTPNGPVVDGPFANWITPRGAQLIRNVGVDGELFTATAVRDILSRGRYQDIIFSRQTQPRYNFESHHGGIHVFCGGTLSQVDTSAYDPGFLVLHTFVDNIFHRFRENLRARGVNPQIYPDIVGSNSPHHSSAPTGFGDLRQVDGYSNAAEATFEYQPPPVCSASSPQCGSRYLTCLVRIGRCVPITAATAASLPPDAASSPNAVSLSRQLPGRDDTDTRCLRQENSHGPAIQNDFCINNACDTNEWVMLAVEIISVRPPNFKEYRSYPVHNGRVDKHNDIYSQRAFARTNRLITERKSNPKTYERCKGNSSDQVFLSSRGISYHGYYKEAAIVDQRLAVSISVGFVAVKKPTEGEVTTALIRAHDSCGRVCQSACKDELTGQYKKCKGAIAISSDKPLMYGTNYDEAVRNVFDYEFNLPQFKSNNIFMAFHCDYRSNFPFTDYKNSSVLQPAADDKPPAVVPPSHTDARKLPEQSKSYK